MNVKTLPNNVVIAEVINMLKTCERVVLPVKGYSMNPFIVGGRDSVELVKPLKPLKDYDVVLAWVDGCRYVVHRIVALDGDQVTLMGDGNLNIYEHCRVDEVVAVAEYVVKPNGERRYLYTNGRLRAARWWRSWLPVRRWLLAVYRRTLLKLNITV